MMDLPTLAHHPVHANTVDILGLRVCRLIYKSKSSPERFGA